MLGVAGNCKSKEKFIDVILQLEEGVQAILMEVMMKYIPKEEAVLQSPPSHVVGTVEQELLESLNTQLKQKEIERMSLIEHMKKVEAENQELSKKVQESQSAYKDVYSESQQNRQEFENYRSRLSSTEMGRARIQQEKELEEDIDSLTKDLEETRRARMEMEKEKDEEIAKLKDELALAQQTAKKLATTESLAEQQKKRIEELSDFQHTAEDEAKRADTLQMRTVLMEKEKRHLDEKTQALVESLYAEKNETRRLDGELKKLANALARSEKEKREAEEQCKFWEQKTKAAEEALATYKKDHDSNRASADGGNMLLQEREATHQLEIGKLQEEIQNLMKTGGEAVRTYTFELEAQAKSLRTENEKLGQELAESTKTKAQLEMENDRLKSQNELLVRAGEESVGQAKELQRVRKERDMLLEGYKRAQDALKELAEQKQANSDLHAENDQLKKDVDTFKKEKNEAEEQCRPLRETNLRLEKELARAGQKLAVIQEERAKFESIFSAQRSEPVSPGLIMEDRRSPNDSRKNPADTNPS